MNRKTKIYLFLFLTLFYGIIFYCLRGLGGYWDWSFPLFASHTQNYFLNDALSWNENNLGMPMGYSANYFFRFLIWLISFLKINPEILLSLLLIFVFTLGTYAGIKIIFSFYQEKQTNWKNLIIPTLGGIILWINPAIFYKLLAGHFYYFFSYAIFIWMVEYLLNKEKFGFREILVLSLFLAFIGIQFQFFIFAAFILLLYLIIYHRKFELKSLFLLIVLPCLINLPWLSNFVTGANSISSISTGAGNVAFSDSVFASPVRLALMTFSQATNIQYVYAKPWLLFFGLITISIFILMLVYFIKNKKRPDKFIIFLTLAWVILLLLGTGYYQKFSLPFVKTLYPIFREEGHLAPIILFLGFLLFFKVISQFKLKRYQSQLIFFLTLMFIGVNTFYYVRYLPRINYADLRAKFQQFEDFKQEDTSTYRILTYPFWNQYGFIGTPDLVKNGKLLNNSAWDSFAAFSGQSFVSNYAAGGQSIDDTLQYKLLTNYDVTPLLENGVKYIYDFSGIYQSNWDKYTSPESFGNNINLIKNNPEFFSKLLAANPGKIKKISENIYELKNIKPRLYLDGIAKTGIGPTTYFKKINSTQYRVYIKGLSEETKLNFLESYNSNWKLGYYPLEKNQAQFPFCGRYVINNYTAECMTGSNISKLGKLFSINNQFAHQNNNNHNQWIIDLQKIEQSDNDAIIKNNDGTYDLSLIIYFQPQTFFVVANLVSLITLISVLVFLRVRKNKTNVQKV